MSRLPIVAGDLDNWGTILNDFLLQLHKADGTLRDAIITAAKIDGSDAVAIRTLLDIADTGSITALIDDLSGVTDPATARNNLSVYSTSQVYTQAEIANIVADYLLLTGGALSNFLTLHADPTSALHAATKQYVDSLIQPMKHEVFTSTGTFTVPAGVTDVLISGCGGGGGGGGGSISGGGGGAGGQRVIDHKVSGLIPLEEIVVTINKGSAGAGGSASASGLTGGSAIFTGHITMVGGDGGEAGAAVDGGAGGISDGIGGGSGGTGGDGTTSTDGAAGLGSISHLGGTGGLDNGANLGGGGGGGGGYEGAGGNGGNFTVAGSNGLGLGAGGGGGGSNSAAGDGQFGILIVKW